MFGDQDVLMSYEKWANRIQPILVILITCVVIAIHIRVGGLRAELLDMGGRVDTVEQQHITSAEVQQRQADIETRLERIEKLLDELQAKM